MNEIVIVAAKRLKFDGVHLYYEIPQYAQSAYSIWVNQQEEKKIDYDKIVIRKPFKARTTGDKSQNHHINGHIQDICIQTGNDFETMKQYLKKKAIRRGYPFDTDPDGDPIPWSESRIDTTQAGYLIDEIHQFADENGYWLKEEGE